MIRSFCINELMVDEGSLTGISYSSRSGINILILRITSALKEFVPQYPYILLPAYHPGPHRFQMRGVQLAVDQLVQTQMAKIDERRFRGVADFAEHAFA